MNRKEALQNVKRMIGFSDTFDESIFTLFPELKESEDERIRKAILGLVYLDGIEPILTKCSVTRSDILTYLEKQKEQKPEAKLTGWVVRDRSGEIWVHDAYPKKEYEIWTEGRYLPLNQNSFPDLKWEDEPVEVEITIRRK